MSKLRAILGPTIWNYDSTSNQWIVILIKVLQICSTEWTECNTFLNTLSYTAWTFLKTLAQVHIHVQNLYPHIMILWSLPIGLLHTLAKYYPFLRLRLSSLYEAPTFNEIHFPFTFYLNKFRCHYKSGWKRIYFEISRKCIYPTMLLAVWTFHIKVVMWGSTYQILVTISEARNLIA